jgi:hypothetical protein
MMFRLAYRHSLIEAAAFTQPGRMARALDLAEAVFGVVPVARRGHAEGARDVEQLARKGRVSVGLALAPEKGVGVMPEVKCVLGAPKASFYPNYIEQSEDRDNPGSSPRGGRDEYRTLMSDRPLLRGWKRYRPHDSANPNPPIPENVRSERVFTYFSALAKGTTFVAPVRVHNLRRVELGALLWAATFGGDAGCVHTIGMAKTFGFGSVCLKAGGYNLVNASGERLSDDDVQACVKEFMDMMRVWASGRGIRGAWADSVQIQSLLGCARPVPRASGELVHLNLRDPVDQNQFRKAKQMGLALPAPFDVQAWRAKMDLGVAGGGPASGGAAKPASTAPTSPQRPSPPVAPALDPNDPEFVALRRAFGTNQHVPILRRWMIEGGPREKARVAMARAVLRTPSDAFRKAYPDLMQWLKG